MTTSRQRSKRGSLTVRQQQDDYSEALARREFNNYTLPQIPQNHERRFIQQYTKTRPKSISPVKHVQLSTARPIPLARYSYLGDSIPQTIPLSA